jgi:glucose/arabinose dehydrogenase
VADPNSEQVVLTDGPFPDHYGGELSFGPLDGYLYFGIGTGSGSSPDSLGQDLTVLRGKLLRIDVETRNPATYTIPPTNPYVGTANARQEIWATGLRNPWRSSFNRQTGDYFIANVGQAAREEVDFEAAGGPGGANYGWNIMEGAYALAQPAAIRRV